MHVLQMIEKIKESKGKAKFETITFLQQQYDTTTLKTVVEMTYKQGIAYHITELVANPKPKFVLVGGKNAGKYKDTNDNQNLEYMFGLLLDANMKGSVDASDKNLLTAVYTRLTDDDRAITDLVLRHDLKCGASLATFQKVWGNDFCPMFPKLLCESYNEKKIARHINFPAFSQLKSDGARAQKVPINSVRYSMGVYSRGGQVFGMMSHIERDCSTLFGDDYTVDGELVVLDENGEILPRSIGNGLLNKFIKGTGKMHVASRVRFMVWDVIPIREWEGDIKAVTTTKQRWDILVGQMEKINIANCSVILTENRIVNSLAEASAHYQELVAQGHEGTILKDMNGVWEDGRSSSQYKFKEEFEADFAITGWYFGKKGSKYEKLIGGFEFESKCGMVTGNCGGGLKDVDRELNGDEWIGKCIEIKYNARSKKEGRETWALSHSRKIELRFDKDASEANTLDEIVAMEDAVRALTETGYY